MHQKVYASVKFKILTNNTTFSLRPQLTAVVKKYFKLFAHLTPTTCTLLFFKLPIKQVHFDNSDMSLKILGVLYHHFYLLFAPMKFWEFAILSGNCMMDNTCCRAVIDPKTANSLLIRGFAYAEQTFTKVLVYILMEEISSEFTCPNSY